MSHSELIVKFLKATNYELLFDASSVFLHAFVFRSTGSSISARADGRLDEPKEVKKLYELKELCRASVPSLWS